MKEKFTVALLFFCCLVPHLAGASSDPLPFQVGEKSTYNLRWGMVHAGTAELAVLPMAEFKGRKAWRFSLSVRTNKFLDKIYKVRDRIDSYAALDLDSSLLYTKVQNEGDSHRRVRVDFDQAAQTAQYSNKGKSRDPIEIMPGTMDPLTILFYSRAQDLSKINEVRRPITDGKRNMTGLARVVGRERLEVNGVTYDTIVVEPDLRDVRGVFEKSKGTKTTLWFTNDDRRLLVRVASKVRVGSFVADLIPQVRSGDMLAAVDRKVMSGEGD
ncbi:MAG: DUF3108 domain-containing protein [Thermodesulfobacteriota bacterium]